MIDLREPQRKEDNLIIKKREELEYKFDNVDNLYPTLLFKGHNMVDLDFVCKQLLDGCKAYKTALSLTQ